MSKWRPNNSALNALYVIADMHGALELFQKICDRILPLRKSDGGKDKLILLGDYIDRHSDSHKLIDFLIELKKEYNDQLILLRGNHEQMLLKSLNLIPGRNFSLQDLNFAYTHWTKNGGFETIAGYLERKNLNYSVFSIERYRVIDLIPKEHIDFFLNLEPYYETDKYLFVHAGCNPDQSISEQDPDFICWDRKLHQRMKKDSEPLTCEKIIVTGHNGPEVFVRDKYMMLDAGSPDRLLVAELNSMEAFMATPGKTRLVKFDL